MEQRRIIHKNTATHTSEQKNSLPTLENFLDTADKYNNNIERSRG